MRLTNRQGQVTVEMAVLFTFVIAGIMFMGPYLQRAAQGGLKSNADGIGSQFSINGNWGTSSSQHSQTSAAGATGTASCNKYQANLTATGGGPAVTDADVNCAPATPPTAPVM